MGVTRTSGRNQAAPNYRRIPGHKVSPQTEAEPVVARLEAVSGRPSAIPEARENIIGLVVWNQRMEGIESSPERVAALYDRALANPLMIPE